MVAVLLVGGRSSLMKFYTKLFDSVIYASPTDIVYGQCSFPVADHLLLEGK